MAGGSASLRSVSVGQRSSGVAAGRVILEEAGRLSTRDQVNERVQMGATDLQDVVAFLPQQPGNRPGPVHRDVHQDYPDAEILHFRDDFGEVLLAADHDRIADCPVPGQGGQVAVHLGLDAIAAAGPHPAEPQLEARQVGKRVVLGCPAALGRRLVPVAPQYGQAAAVPGKPGQELEQAGIVPGYRVSVAGAVNGHCAIGEHVARVHEQRATIHATPVLPSTRDATSARPLLRQIARIRDVLTLRRFPPTMRQVPRAGGNSRCLPGGPDSTLPARRDGVSRDGRSQPGDE